MARVMVGGGGVCCVRCTVVSFPRGRIFLPTASKTGRIN